MVCGHAIVYSWLRASGIYFLLARCLFPRLCVYFDNWLVVLVHIGACDFMAFKEDIETGRVAMAGGNGCFFLLNGQNNCILFIFFVTLHVCACVVCTANVRVYTITWFCNSLGVNMLCYIQSTRSIVCNKIQAQKGGNKCNVQRHH